MANMLVPQRLPLFERFLSVWVLLAIAGGAGLGVGLGLVLPGAFAALAALDYASINLAVAVLVWAMIFPNDQPLASLMI